MVKGITRLLALGHIASGVVFILLALWSGSSALRVLPHMSTGTVWTNLPMVLIMAVIFSAPLGALGMWFVVLGKWSWIRRPGVRASLLKTHYSLLLLGSVAGAYGIFALSAAQSSAAHGGGLLGGIGLFPLIFGVCVAGVSLLSIIATRVAFHHSRNPREFGDHP